MPSSQHRSPEEPGGAPTGVLHLQAGLVLLQGRSKGGVGLVAGCIGWDARPPPQLQQQASGERCSAVGGR